MYEVPLAFQNTPPTGFSYRTCSRCPGEQRQGSQAAPLGWGKLPGAASMSEALATPSSSLSPFPGVRLACWSEGSPGLPMIPHPFTLHRSHLRSAPKSLLTPSLLCFPENLAQEHAQSSPSCIQPGGVGMGQISWMGRGAREQIYGWISLGCALSEGLY